MVIAPRPASRMRIWAKAQLPLCSSWSMTSHVLSVGPLKVTSIFFDCWVIASSPAKGRSTPGDVYTRVGGSTNTGGAARATPPTGMTTADAATAVIATPTREPTVLCSPAAIKQQSSEGILKAALGSARTSARGNGSRSWQMSTPSVTRPPDIGPSHHQRRGLPERYPWVDSPPMSACLTCGGRPSSSPLADRVSPAASRPCARPAGRTSTRCSPTTSPTPQPARRRRGCCSTTAPRATSRRRSPAPSPPTSPTTLLGRVIGREALWGADSARPRRCARRSSPAFRDPEFLAALAETPGPRHLDGDMEMVQDTFRVLRRQRRRPARRARPPHERRRPRGRHHRASPSSARSGCPCRRSTAASPRAATASTSRWSSPPRSSAGRAWASAGR